eukprot:scaffold17332_cov85-Skeletonema_dohrnii-CCMP3373.AAC.1
MGLLNKSAYLITKNLKSEFSTHNVGILSRHHLHHHLRFPFQAVLSSPLLTNAPCYFLVAREPSWGAGNIGELPSTTLPPSRSCGGGAVPRQCCKEDDEMVIVITTQRLDVDALAVQSSLIHQNQWAHKLPIFDTSLDAHQTIHSLASNKAHPHHMATNKREETPKRERETRTKHVRQ